MHATTLKGTYEELFAGFQQLVDDYVDTKYRRARRRRFSRQVKNGRR